jgi:alpha-tubulin suppressor-like RCC1 family protein
LPFDRDIISIHCGSYHTIIYKEDGIFVFGHNTSGQLGLGDDINRTVPTKLDFNCDIISIHCGSYHTIFNTTDGIYVCGQNICGQLGLGDNIKRNVPTKLSFDHIISIHCGPENFDKNRRIKSAATMI